MKINDSSEIFTHFVINKINPKIKRSLTKEQLDEIKCAIAAGTPLKKHLVDIRGVIPLFFSRFYFVLLMGRDKRVKTKRTELSRRVESDILASILFSIFIIFPFLSLAFIVLYLSKTELGMDLFSDFHLKDFFNS